MYRNSARHYDALYDLPYAEQAAQVREIAEAHRQTPIASLLDVACGTGGHLEQFARWYRVDGLDAEAAMLAVARERLPDAPLHEADMAAFELGRTFDIVTCLFSSIGYVRTLERLRETLRTFAHHLAPGGVAIVEPWLLPADYRPGHVHALYVDRPELKLARMSVSRLEGRVSVMPMHYMLATSEGVERWEERHELALFTDAEYREAFEGAGLTVAHDPEGLRGRGLYVGVKRAG